MCYNVELLAAKMLHIQQTIIFISWQINLHFKIKSVIVCIIHSPLAPADVLSLGGGAAATLAAAALLFLSAARFPPRRPPLPTDRRMPKNCVR